MDMSHINLTAIVDQVGKEKNISKEVIVSVLEIAMLSAARKKLGLNADLEAKFNEDIGEVEVFEFKQIVKKVINPDVEIEFSKAKKLDPELDSEAIGEDLGIKLEINDLGRIAAQNAKQIIVQRVREIERSIVFKEYKDRQDELVTGVARRLERGNIIIDLGRAEGIIPLREQVQKENIRIGDRVVAYILEVLEFSKGLQIVLSRSNPNFVIKLFEQEVPEINDGIIMIESVSREAGLRSKISVSSRDSDVDPVGACVGMKGSRVQAVVQELRGEKIDIVPFDNDAPVFVCSALAPAEVTRVLVNKNEHRMQIIVPDEQVSLAIGKRGQNVRLAAELTGWKIDIDSETKINQEKDIVFSTFSMIKSLNDLQIQTLYNYGLRKISELISLEKDFLISLSAFKECDVERIINDAKNAKKEEENKKIDIKKESRNEAGLLLFIDKLFDEKNNSSNFLIKNINILNNKEKDDLEQAGYIALDDIYFDYNHLHDSGILLDEKSLELKNLALIILIEKYK